MEFCREAKWRDGSVVVSLAEKKNFDCIFWKDGCSVYEVRPVQCETYPFWRWIIADENTWRAEMHECPGIGGDKIWSKEKVMEEMHRHASNRPILWAEAQEKN